MAMQSFLASGLGLGRKCSKGAEKHGLIGMNKVLIDTDYLIDFLKGKLYTKALSERIKRKEIEPYISIASMFEIYSAAFLSKNPEKKKTQGEAVSRNFQSIPIDDETIRTAAKVYAELCKKDSKASMREILVAATSIAKGMPLLTVRKQVFKRMKGVRLKDL